MQTGHPFSELSRDQRCVTKLRGRQLHDRGSRNLRQKELAARALHLSHWLNLSAVPATAHYLDRGYSQTNAPRGNCPCVGGGARERISKPEMEWE